VSAQEKADIIALVSGSRVPHCRTLAQVGLPRTTYYRWLTRLHEGRLEDRRGGSPIPWNKLRPEEESQILAEARTSLE